MSTKIHHGYRIDDGLIDERSIIPVLRATFEKPYLDDYVATASRWATFAMDRRQLGQGLDGTPPAGQSCLEYTDAVLAEAHLKIRRTGHRNPAADFGAEVVLLRDHDGDGALYALLFTERPSYRQAWQGLRSVSEYGYWNNTDQPDGVSDEEWAARRATWDRLLPGHRSPSTAGLSWSLLNDLHTVSATRCARTDPFQVELAIPTIEERRRVLAYEAGRPVLVADLATKVSVEALLAR